MSDMGDMYRSMKDGKKALRAKHGVACPECVRRLPRAEPSILVPQQRCRIHGYVDPRPELTDSQVEDATGWTRA